MGRNAFGMPGSPGRFRRVASNRGGLVAAVLLACGGASASASPAVPPAGGTISVERSVVDDLPESATAGIIDAVGAALASKGFTLLGDRGHSAYVVELAVDRAEIGTGSAKVRGARGAVTPGSPGGVGAGVTLPLPGARSRIVPLERVKLDLWIRKRGGAAVLWHGAAVTVRPGGGDHGRYDTIASDLGEAILRTYPSAPPGLLSVP